MPYKEGWEQMQYDLVIKNGKVILFNNIADFLNADIGINGSKIVTVGRIDMMNNTAAKIIDAKDCIVSPGFIDFHSHVDCNEDIARQLVLQGATTTIGGERNFDGKRINEIAENGFLINHGFLLSESFTLRNAIGLRDPYRPASAKEIDKMLQLADLFFRFGNLGIYFGLEMVPGTSVDEIIELSKLARSYGKKTLIHIRKDGIESVKAVEETVSIVKRTGAPTHLLHLMYMAGNPELMTRCLECISEAISEGLDITADTGLYEAFPTYIGSAILDGDWEKHYNKSITYRDVLISSGIHNGEFCSPSMFEYLRTEYPNTLVTVFAFDEKASEIALKQPYMFVSTNAADGHIYEGIGHPETAGTFPKLIRKYVRQKSVLRLKEALYKITYGPASRFGIERKGDIREGYDADLVIFNYDEIEDTAKFSNVGRPDSPPEGIRYVLVNGKIVVENGNITSNTNAGKLLKNHE